MCVGAGAGSWSALSLCVRHQCLPGVVYLSFPITHLQSHLFVWQVLRLSDTSYCIKIKDNYEETSSHQLRETRLIILLSRQVLKVLIFQMRTPHTSPHNPVQVFKISLSTYLNFHFHLRLSPRMEEESLLFKEKENSADGDGELEHATSHVSADCINNLLTNMGRFLFFSRQGKSAKSGQQSTKGNLRKNTRKRQKWHRYLIWRKVCSREKAIQLNSFQDQRRVLKENPLMMVYLNLPLVALQNISQVKP